MSRTKFTAAGAGMLAGLLLLAGCGSSSSTSSSPASNVTATATSTTAASNAPASTLSGTPITVGFICSCTGPLAGSIGRSTDVIESWAKWTNAHGGLNGHPVKVITADDGQNPAKALEEVKSLIEQDHVMAIVGQMSLTTAAWATYVTSKGMPVVGGQPVDTPFLTNPDFFVSGTNLLLNLYGLLAIAKEDGKKHLGLFYCAETPVCAQAPVIMAAMAKPLGLAVSTQRVSSTAPSYTAPCLAFKQQGVDAVNVAMSPNLVPRITTACAQQGFTPTNLGSAATIDASWTKVPSMDGSLIAASNAVYTDTSVPGVKSFTDALNDYAPGLTSSANYGWPLIEPWAGGQLFAAAAKAAELTPTSSPADVKKGLYALKNETLQGVAPPLNYVPGKPGFPSCYFEAKLDGGGYKPMGGDKPTCLSAAAIQHLAAAVAH
jgi:branched-chain amino acid transport system substrate-binding protein